MTKVADIWNFTITKTEIFTSPSRNGVLVLRIGFDYQGAYQSQDWSMRYNGAWIIRRILETLGLYDFTQLLGAKGRMEFDGFMHILGIGHPTENRWFRLEEEFPEYLRAMKEIDAQQEGD